MAILPSATVSAPTIQEARYGLYSVVNVIPTNDPHIMGGTTYESTMLCADGGLIVLDDVCTADAFTDDTTNPSYTDAVPALLTSLYECTGPMNLAEFHAKAMKAASSNQERILSNLLFPNVFDPADATTATNVGTGVAGALATLEGIARTFYSGQGIIHTAASNVSLLTQGFQIRVAGDHLETQLGTRIHAIADDDDTAMYLTGAVTIWRGNTQVLDPVQEKNGSGNYTNLWRVHASTTIAVANDCGIFYKVTGL